MLTLYETLQEAKEQGKLTGIVLYDLSSAFDTVEPTVVIEKLKVYGFNNIAQNWMKSYLTGRSQITTVSGAFSQPVNLNYGTPQGSRLSPILFLILMADLSLWTTNSKLSNFADDTQSVIVAETEEELRETTSRESAAVVSHFSANNLVNHADKAAILFNNRGKPGNITLEFAGENITAVSSERLLGLQFSSAFDWKIQIESLIAKLEQRLGILRRLKNKVPNNKLRIIAEDIFTSVARYGIAVYSKPRLHTDPNTEDLAKLQVTQNKMFRLLAGKKKVDRIRLEELG